MALGSTLWSLVWIFPSQKLECVCSWVVFLACSLASTILGSSGLSILHCFCPFQSKLVMFSVIMPSGGFVGLLWISLGFSPSDKSHTYRCHFDEPLLLRDPVVERICKTLWMASWWLTSTLTNKLWFFWGLNRMFYSHTLGFVLRPHVPRSAQVTKLACSQALS